MSIVIGGLGAGALATYGYGAAVVPEFEIELPSTTTLDTVELRSQSTVGVTLAGASTLERIVLNGNEEPP